jgi:hypothetical protein
MNENDLNFIHKVDLSKFEKKDRYWVLWAKANSYVNENYPFLDFNELKEKREEIINAVCIKIAKERKNE